MCFHDERRRKLLSSNAVPTLESVLQPLPAADGIFAKETIGEDNDIVQTDSKTNSLHNVIDSNNSLFLLSSIKCETKSPQSFNEADNLLQNTTEDLGTEQSSPMSEVNTSLGKPNSSKRFLCIL